jgi:hypothetical protein
MATETNVSSWRSSTMVGTHWLAERYLCADRHGRSACLVICPFASAPFAGQLLRVDNRKRVVDWQQAPTGTTTYSQPGLQAVAGPAGRLPAKRAPMRAARILSRG